MPEKLDDQLKATAVNWVKGDITVNDPKNRIELTITYYYFRTDFVVEPGIRAFLSQHATGTLKNQLDFAAVHYFPLYFYRYDWSLNRIA